MGKKVLPFTGFRRLSEDTTDDLSTSQVEALLGTFKKTVNEEVINTLRKAILEGPIGRETVSVKRDGLQGTFVPRLQKFMYKTFGCEFTGEEDFISKSYSQIFKQAIPSTVYVGFDDTFFWRSGDFGDGNSCYWGSNKVARFWMRNDPHSLAFHVYTVIDNPKKNNEPLSRRYATCNGEHLLGFGRCLLLVDWPVEGTIIMYNTYPSTSLTDAFAGLIQRALRWPQLHTKKIDLTNKGSGGGWFYTNNRDVLVLSPTKELLDKVPKSIDIAAGDVSIKKFKDWLGHDCTGHDVMTDEDHLKIEIDMFGRESKELYGRHCSGHITWCAVCKKLIVTTPAQQQWIHGEKLIRNQKNGPVRRVCLKCFLEKIENEKTAHIDKNDGCYWTDDKVTKLLALLDKKEQFKQQLLDMYSKFDLTRLQKGYSEPYPQLTLELDKG